MKLSSTRPDRSAARGGFTLVEVAVTIVIVGITLVASLQVLQGAKLTAAQTRNEKLARELALYTLGRIEAGLYWEDVSDLRIDGSYAEEGHPEFTFEAVMGDEVFRERDTFGNVRFDNWRQRDEDRTARENADGTEEETEDEQPYEKVQVKVLFPKLDEFKNEIVLEKWMDWRRVHPEEEALSSGKSSDGKAPDPASTPAR
ncbi:MAG: type II secretion system protein [Planctomycetes bacterium]|nr:type II secretion system protein [Planctomycetota bacterium]